MLGWLKFIVKDRNALSIPINLSRSVPQYLAVVGTTFTNDPVLGISM